MQTTGLIEKIRKLSPETLVEVEHFIDFLTERQSINRSAKNELNGEKTGNVNLSELGISQPEAAAQRAALASFAEDWERPDMEVYDKL